MGVVVFRCGVEDSWGGGGERERETIVNDKEGREKTFAL
jgi:hypothetical protein